MVTDSGDPRLGAESFRCPHCNAVAHQDWFTLFLKAEGNVADVLVLAPETALPRLLERDEDDREQRDQLIERLKTNELTYQYQRHPKGLKVKMANLHLSACYSCKGFGVWVRDRLVFPVRFEPPDLSEEDFAEAATILNKSPRAAAALIHICVQQLVPLINEKGRSLEDNISALVTKGLQVEIQQAMDVLQVIRKSPLNPDQIHLDDAKATEAKMMSLLNVIMERRKL